jgi:hypothetical protein
MATHRIVRQGDGYRIETVAAAGRHWLLRRIFGTEETALVWLSRLEAMAKADMLERGAPERQQKDRRA